MKRILVPVDFSGHTTITCRYALEFARVSGAEIRFFHTYFDQIILADTSFPDTLNVSTVYNEELMKDIHNQAIVNMKELEDEVRTMLGSTGIGGVMISTRVVSGELEHELRELCQDFHPDLVVMGTTGKGNTLQVWGKVSTYIMDHAKVPVVTVPGINSFRGFSQIMYASDLSEGTESTLKKLIELFRPFGSMIHVVHFIQPGKPSEAWVKMKALELKFPGDIHPGLRFNVVEIEEENQKAIDQFVTGRNIDLIAFQPHKRSLLSMLFTRKITRKNLFETNIPMVAMPGKSDQ